MNIPQFTQRQKLLTGAGAAGLLLVLGFSFAPRLELADKKGDDDGLALVDEEPAALVSERTTARALRRARLSAVREIESSTEDELAIDQPRTIVEAPARAITATAPTSGHQVIPPSYKERLALLAEEEEALLQRQKRQRVDVVESSAPVPTVRPASVELAETADPGVEHALAQARRPGRMRRVELIDGEFAANSKHAAEGRGAWLSGKIEIE